MLGHVAAARTINTYADQFADDPDSVAQKLDEGAEPFLEGEAGSLQRLAYLALRKKSSAAKNRLRNFGVSHLWAKVGKRLV